MDKAQIFFCLVQIVIEIANVKLKKQGRDAKQDNLEEGSEAHWFKLYVEVELCKHFWLLTVSEELTHTFVHHNFVSRVLSVRILYNFIRSQILKNRVINHWATLPSLRHHLIHNVDGEKIIQLKMTEILIILDPLIILLTHKLVDFFGFPAIFNNLFKVLLDLFFHWFKRYLRIVKSKLDLMNNFDEQK